MCQQGLDAQSPTYAVDKPTYEFIGYDLLTYGIRKCKNMGRVEMFLVQAYGTPQFSGSRQVLQRHPGFGGRRE